MDEDQTLENALVYLANELEKRESGFASSPASPKQRLREAVHWLHNNICPRKQQIRDIVADKRTEIAALLADAIISACVGVPWVGAVVSRALLDYGVDRFCDDPNGMLNDGETVIPG